MRFDVITLFPELFAPFLASGVTRRAYEGKLVDVHLWNPRDYAEGNYRRVDDRPFGGGPGMVMMAEPLAKCLAAIEAERGGHAPVVLFSPVGRKLDHAGVQQWSSSAGAVLVCGRYEGVDQRVADHLVDGELSVGDYVLAGGELGALVVIEAVARLLPDVLGNEDSAGDESFTDGLLEYPQYTRPAEFRGWSVPEVLRSGDHGAVAQWRRREALLRTAERRPDLLERLVRASALGPSDVQALLEHGYDVPSGADAGRSDPPQPTDD